MSGCQHDQLHSHSANGTSNESSEAHLHEGLVYCELPSWEDFALHFSACLGVFAGLVVSSVLLSSCRSSWNGEFVSRLLRRLVSDVSMSRMYLCIVALIALLVCVLHVVRFQAGDIYGNAMPLGTARILDAVEAYSCFLHLFEVLVIWLFTTAKSSGGIKGFPVARTIVDSFLLTSIFLRYFSGTQRSHFSFAYVASLRIFGIWNAFRSTLSIYWEGVSLQMVHTGIVLLTFVFFTSMLLQQLESLAGKPWPVNSATDSQYPAQRWSMDSSLYYVAMTIATVGYGDLWPRSLLGQMFTIGIAIKGIYLLVKCSFGILDAVYQGVGGGGLYEKNTRNKHVIVAGNPSYQVLVDFVQELFHEDHMQESEDLNLVLLLNPGLESTLQAMKSYLNRVQNRRLQHRVWVLQGSAVKSRDLDRVGYKDATMAWLLPNLYSEDAQREDLDNAMRALAMLRHTKFVRIAVVCLKVEHRPLLTAVGIPRGDILCAGELKVGILGKACQVQGFAAWAAILLKNTKAPERLVHDLARPWMAEFTRGLENELYEVNLSKAYLGAPFGAIALDVVERSEGKAFLVGYIEEAIFPGDTTATYVFPGRSVHIGSNEDKLCKGIFIAACREDIRQHVEWKNFAWSIVGAGPADAALKAGLAKQLGAPGLPNAIPEPLATKGAQGFVREWFTIEDERLSGTEKTMVSAAKVRAAKGVQTHGKVSQFTAARLVGGVSADAVASMELASAEGSSGDAAKALFNQHLEAQREAEREAEVVEVEGEIRKHERSMAAYARVMNLVTNEEVDKWRGLDMAPEEKDQDDELWGGAAPPAMKLWGSPKEPPPALLVRGGHALILSLDADDTAEDRGGGSPTNNAKPVPCRKPGSRHGLMELVGCLHAGIPRHRARPLVVLANEVPYDWPAIVGMGDVYLVLGPPLSGSVLRRGGLQQAHVVVVHQLKPSVTDDPSTVDSEAVLACRLVESLITAAGKDIPVICDIMLERNAFFIPHVLHSRRDRWRIRIAKDTDKEKADEDELPRDRKLHTEDSTLPFYMQTRFAVGQLFVSSVITATAANMMYNPALSSIFQELLSAGYMVLPLDEEWTTGTYADLFRHFMKRRNVLPVGLLRKMSHVPEDEEAEDEDEGVDALGGNKTPGGIAGVGKDKVTVRWNPRDCPSERIVIVMPPGDMQVAEHDGVICMMPTRGKPILPPLEELVAPPSK